MLRWLRKLSKPSQKPSIDNTVNESRDTNKDWERLSEILGFSITDKKQYERALRHRSIIDESQYEVHETYERLEFLGDSVLDLIITELVFLEFPGEDEGFLTKLRAKLVKKDTLAELAIELGLNSVLQIGERAQGQGIELSRSILSDIFESLIAAIYLTEGYSKAYQFVERVYRHHVDFKQISKRIDNYKSLLMEMTQAERMSLPSYRVVEESGPGHDKTFEVAVSIEGRDFGRGTGKSKKQAEQDAAKQAIKRFRQEIGQKD